MIYYALVTQHGEGCDYTIACGLFYFKLEADNIDDAKEEFKKYLDNTNPDIGWKEAILLECNKEIKKIFNQPEWTNEIIGEKE